MIINKKIVFILCLTILVGLFWLYKKDSSPISEKRVFANRVTYTCPDKKFIQADFYSDNTVDLALYNANTSILHEKFSLDGSQYINTDKSFVLLINNDDQMSISLVKNGVVTLKCKFQSSGE